LAETGRRSDRAIFVVFVDGTAVGLAGLYRSSDDPRSGELVQVWVAPTCRGKGLAKQLIDVATEWARRNQFGTVEARVTKDNHRAFPLYRKCGFIQTTTDPLLPLEEFTLAL
jgi:putative acetyltransferase